MQVIIQVKMHAGTRNRVESSCKLLGESDSIVYKIGNPGDTESPYNVSIVD